uniref:intersectin-1-like n=1 Tax=Myxine glutinosa TaxID=7769 RepID=UPI003590174C
MVPLLILFCFTPCSVFFFFFSNTLSESSHAADKSSQRSASVPVSKANLIPTKDDGLRVQATALCPFQSDQACHLSFQKGASIMVIEQRDLWWLGESGSHRGWFPKSYVRLAFPGASGAESRKLSRRGSTPNAMADKPMQQKNSKSTMKERSRIKLGSSTRRGGKGKAPAPPAKEEKCVALYTYSSNEGGDLSFHEGDVITVNKKEGDWWSGSLGGREGIFPANHVRMLQTTETDNPSWALGKKTGLGRVVGLYNYTAHNRDEISFSVGQVITVTKKQHSDWWEGELGGVTGLFPSNYVKAL